MVTKAIKLSISSIAAVTRPLAVPQAASAEPRSHSKPANVLEIGEAEMRLCRANRAAGAGAREANASPADLTSELVRWRGVARSRTDNTFPRLQVSTSTDGDRLNAATRARRNRIEWRLTLLGTTTSEPTYQGLGSRLRACWRIEQGACRKQSMQMQERTPRDDAGNGGLMSNDSQKPVRDERKMRGKWSALCHVVLKLLKKSIRRIKDLCWTLVLGMGRW
jgi:hypothetical protein